MPTVNEAKPKTGISTRPAAVDTLNLPAHKENITSGESMAVDVRLVRVEKRNLKAALLDAANDVRPVDAEVVALAEVEQPVALGDDIRVFVGRAPTPDDRRH